MKAAPRTLIVALAAILWPLAGHGSGIEAVRGTVLSWAQAWSQKDASGYLAFYSPRFHSKGMDLQDWSRHKTNLFADPAPLSVAVEDLCVFIEGDRAEARFIQRYRRGTTADRGEKVLTLVNEDSRWRIVAETWTPLAPAAPERPAAQTCPTLIVKDITVATDPGQADRLTILLSCWREPRVTAIEGADPCLFIDLPGPCQWDGPATQAVEGWRIRRLRTLVAGTDGRLRIRLDLEPGADYRIDQITDRTHNSFTIEVH